MEIGYEASRRNPDFEGLSCVTANEAIAYVQEGQCGTVTRHVDGRTVAGWVFENDRWFAINVFSGSGERLREQRPF